MEIGAMAARAQIASERIAAAAASLGERFGLQEQADALVRAGHKDKDVSALFRAEAAADLLEALESATTDVQATGPTPGVLDGTVDEVSQALEGMTDQAEIEALIREEEAGKNRAGALEALNARLQAVSAEQDAQNATPVDTSVLDGTVPVISEYLANVSTPRELDALEETERAGKNRVSVMEAIAARRAALQEPK
jgi:hypothetical protein